MNTATVEMIRNKLYLHARFINTHKKHRVTLDFVEHNGSRMGTYVGGTKIPQAAVYHH